LWLKTLLPLCRCDDAYPHHSIDLPEKVPEQ